MIFLSFLFLFLFAITLLGKRSAPQGSATAGLTGLAGVFLIIGLGAFFSACVQIIPAGNVGVVSLFGKVDSTPIREGIHLRNPLARVEIISVRTQEYTMSAVAREGSVAGDDSIKVLSKDTLPLNADVTIVFRAVPAMVPWLYRNIGTEEEMISKIVRPASRSAFRNAVAEFTAIEALTTKREALGVLITTKFTSTIEDILRKNEGYTTEAFIVQQVLVRNIEPPAKLKDSIEAKLIAEQDAQRMQYVLQKETQEAERKRIEARGVADYQAIVSQGLTDKLLQWKGIEVTQDLAKSPNAKIIVIGNGKDGLPVILNGADTK